MCATLFNLHASGFGLDKCDVQALVEGSASYIGQSCKSRENMCSSQGGKLKKFFLAGGVFKQIKSEIFLKKLTSLFFYMGTPNISILCSHKSQILTSPLTMRL